MRTIQKPIPKVIQSQSQPSIATPPSMWHSVGSDTRRRYASARTRIRLPRTTDRARASRAAASSLGLYQASAARKDGDCRVNTKISNYPPRVYGAQSDARELARDHAWHGKRNR